MTGILLWVAIASFTAFLVGRALHRGAVAEMPREAQDFFLAFQRSFEDRYQDLQVLGPTAEGFGAIVQVGHQEFAVPLGELFLRERAFPGSLDENVDRMCRELNEHLASIEGEPFDLAMARVLPQIRTGDWVRENSPAMGPGKLVTMPLFEDLTLCFVLDDAESIVFVTDGHLQFWGIDLVSLENLATKNLEEKAGIPTDSLVEKAAGEVIHLQGDPYDATRLLLAMQNTDLANVQSLAIGLPDRDSVILGPKSEIGALMEQVQEDFERGKHPVSPKVYEVRSSMDPT
jgi:hypothetical protein